MSCNVMNEYIKMTQKEILEYMQLMFSSKYDKLIATEFLKFYMNIRYYDLNEKKLHRVLKNDILESLKFKEEKLLAQYAEKEWIIKNTYLFFEDIIYLDNVIPCKDYDKLFYNIESEKREKMKIVKDTFRDEFYELFKINQNQNENFLKQFDSEEFYLGISNYVSKLGVQRVNLKYNFKLPILYNSFAINKAFNSGITNEDKLYVEYYLITTYVIKDIVKGNFKKQYIVEFAESLLKKKQKLERLMNIVNNQAIQDKISLKIKYKTYLENKDDIQELMKKGFRFAVILDDSFEMTYDQIERLDMFSYIIYDRLDEEFSELKQCKEIINKIIEI